MADGQSAHSQLSEMSKCIIVGPNRLYFCSLCKKMDEVVETLLGAGSIVKRPRIAQRLRPG